MLGPASGKFPSITADALGVMVTYHDEATGQVPVLPLDAAGAKRAGMVPLEAHGVPDAYPTIYHDGQTWLAWRDNDDLHGNLLNLSTGKLTDLGMVHGAMPFAFGGDSIFWLATGAFDVRQALLATPTTSQVVRRAAGTGISHYDGRLASIDELRTTVPGMANPQRAGKCVVGEADGPDGRPCNIARLDDGREAVLWPGKVSFTPRIATRDGRYYIVTWGAPWGVRLAILEDSDFVVPGKPVPQPPPPAPPTPPPAPKPEEPTVQIPDHFATVRRVSDAHPQLLAENSRTSMTELLWRVAAALQAEDPRFGLLSKSAGENHTEIDGKRVAVDAVAYGTSNEIVDIFGSAYDGPGKGSLTWHTDHRRESNKRIDVPAFPGAAPRPEPKPQEPKPDVPPIPPAPAPVDLAPLLIQLGKLSDTVLGIAAIAEKLLVLAEQQERRREELAKHQDAVITEQATSVVDRLAHIFRTTRVRLW